MLVFSLNKNVANMIYPFTKLMHLDEIGERAMSSHGTKYSRK